MKKFFKIVVFLSLFSFGILILGWLVLPRFLVTAPLLEKQGLYLLSRSVKETPFFTLLEDVTLITPYKSLHLDSLKIGPQIIARCGAGEGILSYRPLWGGRVMVKNLSGSCLGIKEFGLLKGDLEFHFKKGFTGGLEVFDIVSPLGPVDLKIKLKGWKFRFFSPQGGIRGEGEIRFDSQKGLTFRLKKFSGV